jgi:hypothetical protein
MYVPWKLPAKALARSSQLEICAGGRCSSQARAASERNRGRLRMMRLSSSVPPSWQVSHPVLEGKPNANHVRARISYSRTQQLHNMDIITQCSKWY